MSVRFTPQCPLYQPGPFGLGDTTQVTMCEECGAAIIIPPQLLALDPVKKHRRWHEQMEDTMAAAARPRAAFPE